MFGLFKKRKSEPTSRYSDYLKVQIDINKEFDTNMQSIEDSNIERSIKREAVRMFNEWRTSPEHEVNGEKFRVYLPIISPLISFYTIYDEESAKYKDVQIRQLVMAEYNRLKDEFNNN